MPITFAQADEAMRASDFGAALGMARAVVTECATQPARAAESLRAQLLVGELLQLKGDFAQALDGLAGTLTDALELGDHPAVVMSRCRIALSLSDSLGLYESALAHACSAYRLAEATHSEDGIIQSLTRMTGAYARIGEADRAERIGLLALSLARDRGHVHLSWRAMASLTVVCNIVADDHEQSADYAAALLVRGLAYARRAQQLSRSWGRADGRAMSLLILASSLVRSGEFTEALATIDQCREFALAYGMTNVELATLRERATCQMAFGDDEAAYRNLMLATTRPHFAEHPRLRRQIALLLANCCSRLGRSSEAAEHLAVLRGLEADHEASRHAARQRFALAPSETEDVVGLLSHIADAGHVQAAAQVARRWATGEPA